MLVYYELGQEIAFQKFLVSPWSAAISSCLLIGSVWLNSQGLIYFPHYLERRFSIDKSSPKSEYTSETLFTLSILMENFRVYDLKSCLQNLVSYKLLRRKSFIWALET